MRPFGSPESLQRRRAQAIQLIQAGQQPVEIARRLGVDRRSVRRWHADYRKSGEKGIQAKPVPGRPSRLTDRQKKRLEQSLLKGAQACGFSTDLWTCARVTELVRQFFGVQYHLCHMWRLLRAMGWSCQKPSRRAIERDEALIERWIKVRWPALKKSP
jgi:transposase